MMDDSDIWDVDRLAATNLAAALGLQPEPRQLHILARHLAQHRLDACGWSVERVRSNLLDRFASISADSFQNRPDQWSDGFRFAEQATITMTSEELLKLAPRKTITRGQRLRALIRMHREKQKA